MERIDLHTHTLASDGSDTPAAVVQQAAALGLRAVAVTDHDTFAGLPEALAAVDGRADPALEQLRTGAVHSEGKASEKSGGIPENGTVDRV